MIPAPRVPAVIRRVYLVLCDHSVAGVWFTERDADKAVRLRKEQATGPIDHHVLGPFVLKPKRGQRRTRRRTA